MKARIPDALLEHVWVPDPEIESPDVEDAVDKEPARIGPDFYQANGTPVDYYGNDMVYSHTECEAFGRALDLLIGARAHVPTALSEAIGELLELVERAKDAREMA